MRRFGNTSLNAMVALTLLLVGLLAGCGQQPDAATPTPDGYVVANVGVESGHLSTQALDLQGLEAQDLDVQDLDVQGAPYDTAGNIAVGLLEVAVFDKNDNQISFTASGSGYEADANGTFTTIPLTPANQSAALTLMASGNPYRFEAHGYKQPSDPSVIAYDSQTKVVGSHSNVRLSLTSVLGEALLVPRYPANYTYPGSPAFDLLLVVMGNGHTNFPGNGDYLQVPLGDYTTQHGVVTGATLVDATDRGMRLEVTDCQVNVAQGKVTGLVWNGTEVEQGEIAVAPYSIGCQTAGGSVEADLEAPSVSISYDSASLTATGQAADNDRIVKVQVWDGAALMASTDQDEAVGAVAYFQFDLGLDSFSVVLDSQPLGGLVALAFDSAGNEGRSMETLSLGNVWVDETAAPGGDGSEASPFTTIQAGVSAVDVGGTVWVKPGTYQENVIISRNLRLLATGGRAATSIIGRQSGSELGTVVITGGTTGVQLGDVGHGFHIVGIDGPMGIEKAAVYFQGAHSDAAVIGNEIEANGDAGLTTEYNLVVDGLVISNNLFSGQTFTGSTAGGEGFANQFGEANVPRQLVVVSQGSRYATFTDNTITGTAGGMNSANAPQGNTLVTIDAADSLIANNHFEGYTTRYGTSLRARGTGSTIIGNAFVSTNLPDSVGHLFVKDIALDGALVNANTFDRGVWVEGSLGGTVGLNLPTSFPASSAGMVVNVLAGEYSVSGHIAVNAAGLTLRGPNAGVAQGDPRQAEAVINSGIAINSANVTIDGFALEGFGNYLGDVSAVYLADGATGTRIGSNVVTGNGAGRGVVNAINGTADARIVGNTFQNLTSGTFAQGASVFWVEGNLFAHNAAGSSNDAIGSTIVDNVFMDNEEGIGLGATGVTITNNSFETGHDSYITDYTAGGSYNLSNLISENSFDSAPNVGAYHPVWSANQFPAVVP